MDTFRVNLLIAFTRDTQKLENIITVSFLFIDKGCLFV